MALFTPEKELPEISAAHLKVPEAGDRGYALSKWVNEVFLEKVSTIYRVPGVIHRAVNIVGEGAPETDLMTALDTYTMALGAVPDLRNGVLDGDLDIVEIDEVASGIVATLLPEPNANWVCRDSITAGTLSDLATHKNSLSTDSLSTVLSRPPPTPLCRPSAAPTSSQWSGLSSAPSSTSLNSTSSTIRASGASTAPSSAVSSCDSFDGAGALLPKDGVDEGESEQEIFRFINYCSEVKIGPEDVKQYMEKRLGRELDELPFQTWLEKSLDIGMNRLVNFFLQDGLRQGKPTASPCLRKGRV